MKPFFTFTFLTSQVKLNFLKFSWGNLFFFFPKLDLCDFLKNVDSFIKFFTARNFSKIHPSLINLLIKSPLLGLSHKLTTFVVNKLVRFDYKKFSESLMQLSIKP